MKTKILCIITNYEPFYEEVEAALNDFDPNEASPEIWNEIAAGLGVEQERLEEDAKNSECIHPYLDPSVLPEEEPEVTDNQEPRQYTKWENSPSIWF